MILECPHCQARFLVADSLVPAGGRTVKCGSCSKQWHVTHPEADPLATEPAPVIPPFEEAPAKPRPIPAGSNVPAIKKRRPIPTKPFKIAAPILVVLWLLLAGVAYFPTWMQVPGLSGLYHLFGVTETQGLAFADVHMKREQNDTKTRFIVSGSIINHAAVERSIPQVYVALKDSAGKLLWGRAYPVNMTLKPGEVYPFRIVNIETSLASSATALTLDLGNTLSLAVR